MSQLKRLQVSFSGGETSGFMAQYTQRQMKSSFDEVIFLFANTGQENEETLEFVDQCDKHFGLNVVWLESVINPQKGEGTTHKVVDFKSASRNGDPFEAAIAKFGIPNMRLPHCTRELKQRAMESYTASIGWGKPGEYKTAIGIRADEFDRMSVRACVQGFIYPLVGMGVTKEDVNIFWRDMPFRLQLKGYQGNCKWCWKKSLRKQLTIISENPAAFDFPERMERLYGHVGAHVERVGEPQVFFRGEMSTQDIRKLAAEKKFVPADDDAIRYAGKQFSLDLGGSCGSESCEIGGDGA